MYRHTILSALALLAPAFAADGPTARDRYFEASRSQDPEWVGVRTSVLLKNNEGGKARVREVGESADFRSGDQFRLRVQPNDDGYLYLMVRAQDGGYKLLYPAKGNSRATKLKAFEVRTIPGRSKEWMVFDNKPAIEGLFLFLSAKPIPEIDAASASGTMSQSGFDRMMEANGRAASLRFDDGENPAVGVIPATYYVERRASGRTFAVRQIDLVHRTTRRGGDR